MPYEYPVSLHDYWDQLHRHDWRWGHADNFIAQKRGSDEQHRLASMRVQSPEHDALFQAMSAWAWWKAPLPPQPEPDGHALLIAAEDDARIGGEL